MNTSMVFGGKANYTKPYHAQDRMKSFTSDATYECEVDCKPVKHVKAQVDNCAPVTECAPDPCASKKAKGSMAGGAIVGLLLAIAALTAFIWIIGYSYGFSWYVDSTTLVQDKKKNFLWSFIIAIVIVAVLGLAGFAIWKR